MNDGIPCHTVRLRKLLKDYYSTSVSNISNNDIINIVSSYLLSRFKRTLVQ